MILKQLTELSSKSGEIITFRLMCSLIAIILVMTFEIIEPSSISASYLLFYSHSTLLTLCILFLVFSFNQTFQDKYLTKAATLIYYVGTFRVLMIGYNRHFLAANLITLFIIIQIFSILLKSRLYLFIYLLSFSSLTIILIRIDKEAAFNQQQFFILVLVIILLTVINYLVNFFRINNSKEREQNLEKIKASQQELEEIAIKLQKANLQLVRQNQELDKFSYIVSHDLKAPLRAISNLSSWIEEDLEDVMEEETKGHINRLRGRVVRMENLIDGLLAYHRVGKKNHHEVEVDTYKLVVDTIAIIDNSENFNFDIQKDLPIFITNKRYLHEIFFQLIDNAIKHHTNQQGTISIKYRQEGNTYVFAVSDDGEGILEKYHDKIFIIFQTLKARDVFESIGVGLTIVKKIIDLEGQKIWLESDKDKGTTFFFTWKIN